MFHLTKVSSLACKFCACRQGSLFATTLRTTATPMKCCHIEYHDALSSIIRYRLCQQKDFLKFANMSSPQWTENLPPTSPSYKIKSYRLHNSTLHPPMCKWKEVYMKAHMLSRHWKLGVYSVAPLIRGHRLPVTSISCEGM